MKIKNSTKVGQPIKLHVPTPYLKDFDSITLNLHPVEKIFYALVGLLDGRYWRGNRNDTLYYFRLLRAKAQPTTYTLFARIVVLMLAITEFYHVFNLGDFEIFGQRLIGGHYDSNCLPSLIIYTLLFFYIIYYNRRLGAIDEEMDIKHIKVMGANQAIRAIK
jgi:hypothetical protein